MLLCQSIDKRLRKNHPVLFRIRDRNTTHKHSTFSPRHPLGDVIDYKWLGNGKEKGEANRRNLGDLIPLDRLVVLWSGQWGCGVEQGKKFLKEVYPSFARELINRICSAETGSALSLHPFIFLASKNRTLNMFQVQHSVCLVFEKCIKQHRKTKQRNVSELFNVNMMQNVFEQ